MNKYENFTLPEDVKNNKNYRVYIKYTLGGEIACMFNREVDKRDGREPAIVDGQQSTRPVFYGEWRRVPQDEIDRLNAENETKKKREQSDKALLRDLEIEEMEKLLAALKASVNDNQDQDLDSLSDILGGIYEE